MSYILIYGCIYELSYEYLCVYLWVCAYEYRCPWRLEVAVGSLGDGVTDGSELPNNIGARKQILVLFKNHLTTP